MTEVIKPTYKKFFIKSIPVYLLILLAGVIMVLSFGLFSEYSRDDKTMDKNIIVYADVTRIENARTSAAQSLSPNWHVIYEYNDGMHRYRGSILVRGEANAEKYRSTGVKIYIDGKGHNVAPGNYKGQAVTKRALIVGVVSLIIFCIVSSLAIYAFVRQRKKIKNLENQNDA